MPKQFNSVDAHPDFTKLEEEILSFWEKNKIFEKSLEQTKDGEPFVFYEGPPTANGKPGLHHVEARSFKDLIPRYQTMRGRFVSRQAGWDTHGLPVELQVEKKLGISGKQEIESLKDTVKESIAYFNKLCRESVWEFKEDWEKLTKRMGFWIDMSDPYITYENSYIEKVWGVIKKIYDKGLIYQGHKVVPYCPRCGTALSSHEVSQGYKTVHDESVYVKFKITNPDDFGLPSNSFLLAWTTTPWTLPGNLALAVGKDIDYVVVEFDGENYILAKDRLGVTLEGSRQKDVTLEGRSPDRVSRDSIAQPAASLQNDSGEYKILNTVRGSELAGLEYEPLYDLRPINGHATTRRSSEPIYRPEDWSNAYKVYSADFVTTEDGTGIVHTAVMYGEDDYRLGEAVGLPKHHTVDEQGKFTDDLKEYGLAGMAVKDEKTEAKIIEYLDDDNLLLKSEKYEHEYPYCWRCDSALLYYARDSWFIKMSEQREALKKNNEEINWVPSHIKDGRFGEWIAEAKDWAISRERYWGTPIPIWACNKGHKRVVGSIAELKEKAKNFDVILERARQKDVTLEGRSPDRVSRDSIAQPSASLQNDNYDNLDLHRPYIDEVKLKCEKCEGEMERTPEVMDVWFDSGAMPFASGASGYPADYISEAIDQTRGWFYTLLAISTLLGEGRSYKNVVCLGLLLDEKGQKMSKSKGNIVDPWDVGEKFGFDVLRWYFYSVNQPGDNKLFSDKELQLMQRKVQLILWNVYKYFVTYANDAGWTPTQSPPYQGGEAEGVLDQWMLARLQQAVNETTQRLDSYNTLHASRGIEELINDLSTWYIRRSRGRSDAEFFATLYHVLIHLAKLLAPFMPYLSEELYQNLHHKDFEESVHLAKWPESKKLSKSQSDLLDQMKNLRDVVEKVHALRAQAGIKLRQPLAKLTLPASQLKNLRTKVPKNSSSVPKFLSSLVEILKDEVNVKEIVEGDALELALELTLELRTEGAAAELTRQINNFRKESGLKIGEMAELYYETDSELLAKAVKLVDNEKVYAKKISDHSSLISNPDHETELEVEEEEIKLFLKIPNNK